MNHDLDAGDVARLDPPIEIVRCIDQKSAIFWGVVERLMKRCAMRSQRPVHEPLQAAEQPLIAAAVRAAAFLPRRGITQTFPVLERHNAIVLAFQ